MANYSSMTLRHQQKFLDEVMGAVATGEMWKASRALIAKTHREGRGVPCANAAQTLIAARALTRRAETRRDK